MKELKTLRDFDLISRNKVNERVFTKELKAEAVKWVKEDLERLKLRNDFGDFIWERPIDFIEEWMRRLDIKKEDLK